MSILDKDLDVQLKPLTVAEYERLEKQLGPVGTKIYGLTVEAIRKYGIKTRTEAKPLIGGGGFVPQILKPTNNLDELAEYVNTNIYPTYVTFNHFTTTEDVGWPLIKLYGRVYRDVEKTEKGEILELTIVRDYLTNGGDNQVGLGVVC